MGAELQSSLIISLGYSCQVQTIFRFVFELVIRALHTVRYYVETQNNVLKIHSVHLTPAVMVAPAAAFKSSSVVRIEREKNTTIYPIKAEHIGA